MAKVDPLFQAVPFDKLDASTKEILASNGKQFGLDARGYYDMRGGVDASGYYGDSWSSTENLTPEEYDAVIKGAIANGLSGGAIGSAINSATTAKKSGAKIDITTGTWSGGTPTPSGGSSGSSYNPPKPLTYTATDGKSFTDQQAYVAYQQQLDAQRGARQSAYDLLYQQFNEYGLGSLVTPLKGLIESGISPSEFTLRLRESEAYKKRFAANQGRIAKGLRALSEAEYLNLEDQYQNVMRNYGLPASYYAKGDMGVQPGFEKFISGDVSPAELEDRIQTAQNRVINAAPEVTRALKQFYPDITNGDILAYALDPEQALTTLKRKVTAAEIGGAALQAGLETGLTRAEELQKYGVTQAQAQQGYQAIAGYLPRASTLSDIYSKQGVGPYTQTTAEQEVFGLPSAAEAATKRRKLSELEQAAFSGQAGRAGGALARERAGQF